MNKQNIQHFQRRLRPSDYIQVTDNLWQAEGCDVGLPGVITSNPEFGAEEYNQHLDSRDPIQERNTRSQEIQSLYDWLAEYQGVAPRFVSRVAKHLLNLHREPNVLHDSRVSLVESHLLGELPDSLQNIAFNHAIFASSLLRFPREALNQKALDNLTLWANPRPTLTIKN
jgi:hypothetical protein